MGTDIHLYVERRVEGRWMLVVPPKRDLTKWPRKDKDYHWWGPGDCMYESKCYGTYPAEICAGSRCTKCLGSERDLSWYSNRNYDVFSILANVRNGFGFAGVSTGDGVRPIAAPRGLPADVCEWLKKPDQPRWDHTPSWLLLEELLAYDWSQTTIKRGVIPLRDDDRRWPSDDNFVDWDKRGGEPKSYSGGVGGGSTLTISAAAAREMLADPVLIPSENSIYVSVSWQQTYAERADDFLGFVDTFLKPLGSPTDVRIVFGFDS